MLTITCLQDVLSTNSWPVWAQRRGSKFRYAMTLPWNFTDNTVVFSSRQTCWPEHLAWPTELNIYPHAVVALQVGKKIIAVDHVRVQWYADHPYWQLQLGTDL